mmetsp:Transcript_17682/g.55120  ORF Transcript_17682/g.55120 Transcript_17682/m.55120 type:complete len:463 (-) Transcript_17682:1127-2515(-)
MRANAITCHLRRLVLLASRGLAALALGLRWPSTLVRPVDAECGACPAQRVQRDALAAPALLHCLARLPAHMLAQRARPHGGKGRQRPGQGRARRLRLRQEQQGPAQQPRVGLRLWRAGPCARGGRGGAPLDLHAAQARAIPARAPRQLVEGAPLPGAEREVRRAAVARARAVVVRGVGHARSEEGLKQSARGGVRERVRVPGVRARGLKAHLLDGGGELARSCLVARARDEAQLAAPGHCSGQHQALHPRHYGPVGPRASGRTSRRRVHERRGVVAIHGEGGGDHHLGRGGVHGEQVGEGVRAHEGRRWALGGSQGCGAACSAGGGDCHGAHGQREVGGAEGGGVELGAQLDGGARLRGGNHAGGHRLLRGSSAVRESHWQDVLDSAGAASASPLLCPRLAARVRHVDEEAQLQRHLVPACRAQTEGGSRSGKRRVWVHDGDGDARLETVACAHHPWHRGRQ